MKKDGTIKWINDEKGWNDQMNKWWKRMEQSINEWMMKKDGTIE